MGLFGSMLGGNKPMGYYTNQTAPREMLGLGMQVDPAMAQQVPGPGFFGKGGGWKGVVGAIGDGLSVAGGGQPMYTNIMQQRQQQEQERAQGLEDYQRQRTDHNADWIAQQQWKIDHPEAPQPGEQERLIEAASQLPENDPKRQLYERAIRGYANTSEVLGAKADTQRELADYRHGLSMQLRGVPTYGQAHPTGGGGGGSLHGRSKSNPMPVGSREELAALPKGTWISLPNGAVVQRR